MAFTQIVGTPLELFLSYQETDLTTGAVDHLVGPIQLAFIQVPASVSQQLQTPLDALFNSLWAQFQPTVATQLDAAVQSAVGGSAYNLQTQVPGSGTLSAQVGAITLGMSAMLPPGTVGKQIALSFAVPGFVVKFDETTAGPFGAWADPAYKLTFDGELRINVAIPENPRIALAFAVDFVTHGIQGQREQRLRHHRRDKPSDLQPGREHQASAAYGHFAGHLDSSARGSLRRALECFRRRCEPRL